MTGAIQAQLDAKLPLAGGLMSGAITLGSNAAGTSSAQYLGRDVNGPIVNVGTTGNGGALQVMSSGASNMALNETYGLAFSLNQTTAGSLYQVNRTANGINVGVPTGKYFQVTINGVQYLQAGSNGSNDWFLGIAGGGAIAEFSNSIYHDATDHVFRDINGNNTRLILSAAGLVLPTTQTAQFTYPSVSNSSGNFRNGVATGQSFEWLQTNTSTYIATLSDARGLVLYNTGSNVDSNQVSKTTNGVDINTLNCMTLSGPGVTFANNDTWTNFYSLARGTHAGNFKIFCALFGGAVTIRITGTTISITLDDWGGSYADVTAGTGKIAFRVSGGWLQINVGSGISSTPRKFHAQFEGNIQ